MKKNATLILIATTAATVFVAACSAEEPKPAEAPQAKAPKAVDAKIAAIYEKIRAAPGRTGILTEQKKYSLWDEEILIRDFFQDRRDGVFLDIGCAWPIKANNTYYLEKHLGWTGIGVDALSDYGPGWQKERPGSKFYSYLVTDHSDTEDVFYKSRDPGLSSTNPNLASGAAFWRKLETEEIRIPSITLTDLLDREGVERIDLLAMDIEGHEPKALAGLDIERFAPELVLVEGENAEVAAYFDQHGYELIERYLPFDPINRYYRRRPAP